VPAIISRVTGLECVLSWRHTKKTTN